jgi:hypothetical protein
MTNYLETKICDIGDPDFQTMVGELCHCVAKSRAEFNNVTLRFLLMAIGKEDPKCLSEQYLPGPGILTIKVDSLLPDTVVFHVCRELVHLNKTIIESFGGKRFFLLSKRVLKCIGASPRERESQRETSFDTNSERR